MDSSDLDDELDLIPREHDLEGGEQDYFEPLQLVTEEEDLVLPTVIWTALLELDTQPSAQMWFMIHRRLQEVATDHTGING
jgi:hypothetical protein